MISSHGLFKHCHCEDTLLYSTKNSDDFYTIVKETGMFSEYEGMDGYK